MIYKEKILIKNFLSQKDSNKEARNHAILWCLFTLLLCLVMSLIYWYSPLGEYLAASPKLVFENHEYWRLFTSSFIHGDLDHFLSNSLMLGLMGYFVNYHYGSFSFPIIGFLVGILINLIVIWDYPSHVSLVGASGIVHYLWGFWLVLYLFIQRHLPMTRRIFKVTVVGLFILVPTEFSPQVSYYAHFIGLVLGVVFGFIHFFMYRNQIFSEEVWEERIEVIDDELTEEAINFH